MSKDYSIIIPLWLWFIGVFSVVWTAADFIYYLLF